MALLLALGACAQAGSQAPKQDAPVTPGVDSPTVTVDMSTQPLPDSRLVDAPPLLPDAFVPRDAPAVQMDAAPGPFCATNANCTVVGECCFNFGGPQGFCVPGDVVLGQCFPN